MRKIVAFLIIFFHTAAVCAQEKVDLQMMQKIRDEATRNSQIPALAHYLTDVCGPRLTNSPGYRNAVNWSVKTLKQWGLKNAAPEPWGEFGKGWSNEHTYVALKTPYYQAIVAYPAAWSKGTNGLQAAKVILLDKLDSFNIDKAGPAIKGKVVMVRLPDSTTLRSPFKADASRFTDSELNGLPDAYMTTQEANSNAKTAVSNIYNTRRYLEKKGAVALLSSTPNRGGNGTVYAIGHLSYDKGYEAILPLLFLSIEDYLRLQRLRLSGQDVELEVNVQNNWYTDDLMGYNVVADIEGTDPKLKKELVMLGAHLDSWHAGTGATDNAAGCVVMMEAVRILKALGVKPRRTIRIALWGAEEQWLLGSFGYVKKHLGDPKNMKFTDEQKRLSAYYNLDVGTGKIRGIYLQNNVQLKDMFTDWLKPFADLGATGVTTSNTGGTDHLSFDAVGIPAFQFMQDPMEYQTRTHHTNMDVYDHLFMEDLKQAAIIVAAFVYNTAMMNELLPRKPVPLPTAFLFQNGLLK